MYKGLWLSQAAMPISIRAPSTPDIQAESVAQLCLFRVSRALSSKALSLCSESSRGDVVVGANVFDIMGFRQQ